VTNSPKRSTSWSSANARNSCRKSVITKRESISAKVRPGTAVGVYRRMRVITLNCNGIRSAERKGFARWLARAQPWDIVCLQEIKAPHDDIPGSLLKPCRAHGVFLPADKRGYSGVAVYSRTPAHFAEGFGHSEFDAEGRYLEASFGELTV